MVHRLKLYFLIGKPDIKPTKYHSIILHNDGLELAFIHVYLISACGVPVSPIFSTNQRPSTT